MRLLEIEEDEVAGKLKRGAGCKRCRGTGFRGRLGIFEMITMSNELRELAFNRATTSQLRRTARAGGMRSLLEDGKLKILRGVTTMAEVAKHAQAEGILEEDE
jgi:type II secretory ATPase GspE/PulE/Tfp pilus assembly ATPase PilB-like protein